MAISSIAEVPGVLVVTSSSATTTLEKDREYTLFNLGLDSSGSSSTAIAFCTTNGGSVTTTLAESSEKLAIQAGVGAVIGPGVSTLKYKTASGETTLQVVPSAKRLGDW